MVQGRGVAAPERVFQRIVVYLQRVTHDSVHALNSVFKFPIGSHHPQNGYRIDDQL